MRTSSLEPLPPQRHTRALVDTTVATQMVSYSRCSVRIDEMTLRHANPYFTQ